MVSTQAKQHEWFDQWNRMQDHERFLFEEWIWPIQLEDFRGRSVLEAGCGGGQHTSFISPYAKSVVAVDLNTTSIAQRRNALSANVAFVEADVATMFLEQLFDVVLSIGVVHHTDDPDRSVGNLIKHVKPGGLLILWIYSKEGNRLTEYIIEPLRRLFLKNRSRNFVQKCSEILTLPLLLAANTLYRLPLPFLPYYQYLRNARRLSFSRNVLNVFDKLNAPQVQFISRDRVQNWLNPDQFSEVSITSYCGVSWRASGRKKSHQREDNSSID